MAMQPENRGNQGGHLAPRREHPLQQLRREFDSMFDRMWGGMLMPTGQDFGSMRLWDFDVREDRQEIVVRAEMPGFDEQELDVRLDHNRLTIQAQKEQSDEGQQQYHSYYRSVTLPPGIDADKAQASYRNGVLELHIPRIEGSQGKRIPIQNQPGRQIPSNQATTASSSSSAAQQPSNQAAGSMGAKAKKG